MLAAKEALGRGEDYSTASGETPDEAITTDTTEELPEAETSEPIDDVSDSKTSDSAMGDDTLSVWETTLYPGDALFIPQGWYHSVRSVGSPAIGINASANWWFRINKDE
jgi:hypothetical protein